MNGLVNDREHTIHVVRNVIVPETKDPVALSFEPCRPGGIAGRILSGRMLRAINLDHKACGQTCEVCNVIADRNLPSKMTARQWQTAQRAPQALFRIRAVRT
jgi:hypothetical protein